MCLISALRPAPSTVLLMQTPRGGHCADPANMPGAKLSATARERTTLSALVVSLADALDSAEEIDLDGVEVLTGLLAAYVALLNVQRDRKASA
ncbi:hypothetical protein SAV14893_051180 [Streptomyces avermitilis]|uniref:Uncharacterized protein n=2 Tax=Streptomyces TaxID=1883 RepID=A0A4D4LXK1_STRAX|nr:hypothetical protein SAVMC3_63490 [Streptomyces avermitilis]GDY65725.1 hypothetical protein SAV14893_051180 [Streptomyces avermitilis]